MEAVQSYRDASYKDYRVTAGASAPRAAYAYGSLKAYMRPKAWRFNLLICNSKFSVLKMCKHLGKRS